MLCLRGPICSCFRNPPTPSGSPWVSGSEDLLNASRGPSPALRPEDPRGAPHGPSGSRNGDWRPCPAGRKKAAWWPQLGVDENHEKSATNPFPFFFYETSPNHGFFAGEFDMVGPFTGCFILLEDPNYGLWWLSSRFCVWKNLSLLSATAALSRQGLSKRLNFFYHSIHWLRG